MTMIVLDWDPSLRLFLHRVERGREREMLLRAWELSQRVPGMHAYKLVSTVGTEVALSLGEKV